MSFVKLDCGIVSSSLWRENAETRVVFITMLAMADAEGFVLALAPGIAAFASLPLGTVANSIERLEAPDPYSRTSDHEGRRILREGNGYRILNYAKYRQHDHSTPRVQRFRNGMKRSETPETDETMFPSASASVSESESLKEGGMGETGPSPEPLSANRVAVHLAQRWVHANGRAHKRLCGYEKASQTFELALAAGADAKNLENLINTKKGRSPKDLYEMVVPKPSRSFGELAPQYADAKDVLAVKDKATAPQKSPEEVARILEEGRKRFGVNT